MIEGKVTPNPAFVGFFVSKSHTPVSRPELPLEKKRLQSWGVRRAQPGPQSRTGWVGPDRTGMRPPASRKPAGAAGAQTPPARTGRNGAGLLEVKRSGELVRELRTAVSAGGRAGRGGAAVPASAPLEVLRPLSWSQAELTACSAQGVTWEGRRP